MIIKKINYNKCHNKKISIKINYKLHNIITSKINKNSYN